MFVGGELIMILCAARFHLQLFLYSILLFLGVTFVGILLVAARHESMETAFSLENILSADHGRHSSIWMSTQASSPSTIFNTQHQSFGVNNHHPRYDWDKSTADNYRSTDSQAGEYKKIREVLDYNYHTTYSYSRQSIQDIIIDSMLNTTVVKDQETGKTCSVPTGPWIIFTAGAMGAGKTHTIRQLYEQGKFPLDSFVKSDPDECRRLLPEFGEYVRTSPETAGEMTRKEAGMMAEILTEAALLRGQNVLVDGSLRDSKWYQHYFARLRKKYPKLRLGIFHITSSFQAILERTRVSSRSRL
jgi:hypothetical protein